MTMVTGLLPDLMNAKWAPTLRPSQPTWAVSPPINGCCHPHPPSPFVIITQRECWYSFLPSHGGWKAESTYRHYRKGAQPVPKGRKSASARLPCIGRSIVPTPPRTVERVLRGWLIAVDETDAVHRRSMASAAAAAVQRSSSAERTALGDGRGDESTASAKDDFHAGQRSPRNRQCRPAAATQDAS